MTIENLYCFIGASLKALLRISGGFMGRRILYVHAMWKKAISKARLKGELYITGRLGAGAGDGFGFTNRNQILIVLI